MILENDRPHPQVASISDPYSTLMVALVRRHCTMLMHKSVGKVTNPLKDNSPL